MRRTIFTFPGKIGDALMQWPVAHWWARENQKPFSVWLDEKSLKPLVPLFEAQPFVEHVELKDGIENYRCGGQPWHFGIETKEFADNLIFHLGMRAFPQRQITLETRLTSRVQLNVKPEPFARTPALVTDPLITCDENGNLLRSTIPARRVVLHGQGVCPHTQTTPGFWRFLNSIIDDLFGLYDELVFVGSPTDLEVARQWTETYPAMSTFDDGYNLKRLADFIAGSEAVIGCGSMVVALAGILKVPTIRVHDPIGSAPRVIWSNLGDNQLNETEYDLREHWAKFRDRWLRRMELPAAG